MCVYTCTVCVSECGQLEGGMMGVVSIYWSYWYIDGSIDRGHFQVTLGDCRHRNRTDIESHVRLVKPHLNHAYLHTGPRLVPEADHTLIAGVQAHLQPPGGALGEHQGRTLQQGHGVHVRGGTADDTHGRRQPAQGVEEKRTREYHSSLLGTDDR